MNVRTLPKSFTLLETIYLPLMLLRCSRSLKFRHKIKIYLELQVQRDVFGGMGSWNDEPGWLAQDKGLGQVYDELSDQLLRNIRSAILFAINEW